jgi:hypothetical protein
VSFSILPTDSYVSPGYDPIVARIDNYQVYSFAVFETQYSESYTGYSGGYFDVFGELIPPKTRNPRIVQVQDPRSETINSWAYQISYGAGTLSPSNGTKTEYSKAIAGQSFSPYQKITFDMAKIAREYPIAGAKHVTEYGYYRVNADPWIFLRDGQKHNISNLINGSIYDNRNKPVNPKGISTKDRVIKYSYYRNNPYENHPSLIASLDWHFNTITVKKGEIYYLKIVDPMLGTLQTDSITKSEILANPAINNTYPISSLFPESIPDLMIYWDSFLQSLSLNPYSLPYSNQYSGHFFENEGADDTPRFTYPNIANNGWHYAYGLYDAPTTNWLLAVPALPRIDARYVANPVETKTRIVAANNDRWGHGTVTTSDNPPPTNYQIFSVNEYQLFEALQTDDSFGSLTMDSPRILEIHAALDAGRYATDPASNEARVANLGHLIERSAAILGYRPKPDGTIDQAAEKTTYQRAVLKAGATPPAGDYLAGRFGKRGLLMRRLPNKKTTEGWEAGGYVAIHDIPQLLTEVLDQLNEAMNLQDSTSIQIKDGGNTYTYASQLALLVEMATTLIPQKRQLKEIWTSSLVSQQSINEVIAGIGLPTVSKSVTISGAKLPYWGIQPDKSLQREIATVAYNVGLGNGQIL